MELLALLLLAPLVFSNGSPAAEGLVPVDAAARVVQSESEIVIYPPADRRFTMVVVRQTSIGTTGRNPASSGPASSLTDRVEVIVSAP